MSKFFHVILADSKSPFRTETPETVIVALTFSHCSAESRFNIKPAGAAPGYASVKAFVKADDRSSFEAMLNMFDWTGSCVIFC
jgi:hypothetical protein